MDRIKRLRWQQRSLSEDTKQNLSQAEIEVRPMCPVTLTASHSCVELWLHQQMWSAGLQDSRAGSPETGWVDRANGFVEWRSRCRALEMSFESAVMGKGCSKRVQPCKTGLSATKLTILLGNLDRNS
jgi:hypothetical protein